MLRLLGRKTSGNVQKVLWLCDELGLDYEREDYGRQFENTQTPDYLAMNPNAKVPTLVDGDLTIWESNTILRYLAAKAGSDLLPADPGERTRVERWMDWQLASANGPYVTLFKGSRQAPEERGPDYAAAAGEMDGLMRLLDSEMRSRPYVALDRFTLADIALGPTIHRWFGFDVDHQGVGNLRTWYARMQERPAFRAHVMG